MSRLAVRPRFSTELDLPREQVQRRILEQVGGDPGACEVKSFPGFLCIRIPEEQRHFWSPRLTLSLEDEPQERTRIEGVYGPNANLWSLFLYSYLISGSVTIFAGSLGFAQWSLQRTAWGMWIATASIAVLVVVYLLAQLGKRLGADQTHYLDELYRDAIDRSGIAARVVGGELSADAELA